jgi:regulator of replication initiation timing
LSSDELFPPSQSDRPKALWEGLEKRIGRLLETIVQLRSANGQLMKENNLLKNQLKESAEVTATDNNSEELESLRKQHEATLKDLKQLKQNLQRMEELAAELKLEN